MTRRPVHLFVVVLFLLASTWVLAQHSNPSSPSSSSSSSSSSGGHASSAPSSFPSASSSGSSHSGGASYSGGSSASHSSSGGGGNAASHSGGGNHSGGTSGGNANARSNASAGGSTGRGDRNSSASHGAPRNSNDLSRPNNRLGTQPNGNPRSFEPAGTTHGNGNTGREGLRDRDIARPQPGVRESTAREPEDHRSRMSRIFLFWKHPQKNPDASTLAKRENPEIKRPNPCKGAGCKPVCLPGQTLENGACAGKPVKPPQGEVRCSDGSLQVNGACPPNNSAYTRTTAVCDGLARQLDSIERQLQQLYDARNRECARDPNGVGCYNLSNQIVVLEQQLQQLRRQYAACMSAHP